MPLLIDPADENLERFGVELEHLAAQLATGKPWDLSQQDLVERLVARAILGSNARRWRIDSEAEDRIVDAAAEARGE